VRTSTLDQHGDLQVNALREARCERIFEDYGRSGQHTDRPGYLNPIKTPKADHTLVVWRFNPLHPPLVDLPETVPAPYNRRVALRSPLEPIDISSAYGEFVLHILGAVAHFERAMIIERTKAGMAAAKERGERIGRPPVMNGETLREASFLKTQGLTTAEAAQQIGVGRSTLYRYLAAEPGVGLVTAQ